MTGSLGGPAHAGERRALDADLVHVEQRVDHGDVEVLTLAGALAMEEREPDGRGGVHAGADVGDRGSHRHAAVRRVRR